MADQMIPYVDMDQWTDNVVNITDLSLPKCGRSTFAWFNGFQQTEDRNCSNRSRPISASATT